MSTRVAYRTDESFFDTKTKCYVIARIEEDEDGYWVESLWPELELAVTEAQRLNDLAGLTKEDVFAIVASSMFKSFQKET